MNLELGDIDDIDKWCQRMIFNEQYQRNVSWINLMVKI